MTILRLAGSCLALLLLLAATACSDDEAEGDNRAPVIEAVTAEMDEDTVLELDLLSHVSDADGDPLELRGLTTQTGHLITLRDGGKVAVTPALNFHGVLSVQFKVTDKHVTMPGTATITVRPVNDAPEGTTAAVEVKEDTATPFQLTGRDLEGDALTFSIVEAPAHGTVSGAAPDFLYTPAPDFAGSDVIRYQVSDGAATSVHTVAVKVINVNDAPVVPEQPLAATEDVPLAFALEATDPDGDSIYFNITQQPQHGTLSGSTGRAFTYQPAANYSGADQLTFSVTDGKTSRERIVPISVAPVDDAPVASPRFYSGSEDNNVNLVLAATDIDSTGLTYALATQPAHGSLSGTAPNLIYTPAANYNGSDAFTYTATADGLSSAPVSVSISLAPVNDAPVAVNQTLTLLEDGTLSFTLSATDIDSANLSYSVWQAPADGSLSGSGANRTYTTRANANGTRALLFSVFDGQLSSEGTVTFTITPVNDAPVANRDVVATAVNEVIAIPVLGNDVDVDGEALTIDDVTEAAHGQIEIAGDKLQYTPAEGYTGTDEVSYTVIDEGGVASSATVTVGVGEFPAGAPDEPLPFEVAHANGASSSLALSADGRYVVFSSLRRLVSQDDNDREDVYVYERGRRTLRLVSSTSAGVPGNAASTNAQISGNARYVVFESSATNLVSGGDASVVDIFRKDLVTGAVAQISLAPGGEGGNGASGNAKISDDGNRVVFSSMAFNLWPGDGNGAADVFLRDVAAGTTQRMSLSRTGGESDAASTKPVISGDGAVVAFTSSATNLVEGDSNEQADVFVREVAAGVTSRVSITTNGVQGDLNADSPWLSRDGRYVSFLSYSTNFGTYNPGYYAMAYVRDRVSATTIYATSPRNWPQLSGDGRHLGAMYWDGWNYGAAFYDRFASASTSFVSYSSAILATALCSNGRYLAYSETSTGLVHIHPNPR